jgi:hypothetical membrane protein
MLDRHTLDQNLTTRILLLCGAIGPLLFVVVFLIEGATRPDYNPWHTTVSTLSWGDQGWIQIVNFCLFGLLMLCFAIAVRRVLRTGRGSRWGPILFFIVGLGLITAGPFVTDPILGYPPTLPSNGPPSLHGTIHNIASLLVFIALPAACFVMGRRFARDPAWRGWGVVLDRHRNSGSRLRRVVLCRCGRSYSYHQWREGGSSPAGLLERFFSIVGCCWIAGYPLLHSDF